MQHQDEGYWKEVSDYFSSRLGQQYVEIDQASGVSCLLAIDNLSKDDSFSQAAKS